MAATSAAALLRSSAGRVLRSASAIVCKPVTGSHVVRVDGYSHLTQAIAKGQRVMSSTFDIGGHSWRLALYPNGDDNSKHDAHIGVYLHLDSDTAGRSVLARPQIGVLDQLDNLVSVMDCGFQSFAQRGSSWGLPDFISKEELHKLKYLVDDSFAIQCDVAITTVTACSDDMVFISRNNTSAAPEL